MNTSDFLDLLAALGLGSGLGSVLTAVITSRTGRGKARAEAADLLIGAAERVGKMNEALAVEVDYLRGQLDDVHAVVLDFLTGETDREHLAELLRKRKRD